MPTIDIVTHDGKTLNVPLPEGIDPAGVTPEVVESAMKAAGAEPKGLITPITPQAPDTGVPTGTPEPTSFLGKTAGAVMRAVNDRVTDPLTTLFDTTRDPATGELKVGKWDRAMAAGQIAGTVMAPGLTALGAGMQVGSEMLGASPTTARGISAVTEIGGGLVNLVRGVRGVTKLGVAVGKEGAKEVEQFARPGMTSAEGLGQSVQQVVRGRFRDLHQQFGAQFDAAENAIKASTPKINPGAPGYDDINFLLQYADDAQASAGGRADTILNRIKNAVHHTKPDGTLDPQPVDTADFIKLRKILNERAKQHTALDPDASVVGKKASAMMRRAQDVIRNAAPDDLARNYDELRASSRVHLYDPERFTVALTDEATSPLQAFKGVFVNEDPNVARNITDVMQGSSSFRQKMRFGVIESLQDAMKDGTNADQVLRRLDLFAPVIAKHNILSPEEMTGLKFLIQSKQLPSLVRELTSASQSSRVLVRGALGAAAANAVISNPLALGIGAVAFGGMPYLRRAALLPAGSKAQKKLLGVLIRNSTKGFHDMFGGKSD